MLSLPKLDRLNLSDLLQIPESQMAYITNSQPGHGLIFNGKTCIAFENDFPKGTGSADGGSGETDGSLYSILSTSADKDKLLQAN